MQIVQNLSDKYDLRLKVNVRLALCDSTTILRLSTKCYKQRASFLSAYNNTTGFRSCSMLAQCSLVLRVLGDFHNRWRLAVGATSLTPQRVGAHDAATANFTANVAVSVFAMLQQRCSWHKYKVAMVNNYPSIFTLFRRNDVFAMMLAGYIIMLIMRIIRFSLSMQFVNYAHNLYICMFFTKCTIIC